MAKLIAALVLCDVVAHELKAGSIVEASPDLIKSLVKSGDVDDHKDAVAYARTQSAPVMRSSVEAAAEAKARKADELRIEIARLEDLAGKPEADEATKAALQQQLHDRRAALAALI